MKVYIVIGENNNTYGVFTSKEDAQKKIREIYANDYFGALEISEDDLI